MSRTELHRIDLHTTTVSRFQEKVAKIHRFKEGLAGRVIPPLDLNRRDGFTPRMVIWTEVF